MGLRIFYATLPPSGRRPDRHQDFFVKLDHTGKATVTLTRSGLFTHRDVLNLESVTALTVVDEESIRGQFSALVFEATNKFGVIGGAVALAQERSRKDDPFTACALTYRNERDEVISLLLWGDAASLNRLLLSVPKASLTKTIPAYLAPCIAPDLILTPKKIDTAILFQQPVSPHAAIKEGEIDLDQAYAGFRALFFRKKR